MADILFLRGASAFSAFRFQGLQQRIAAAVPGARLAGAEYWHVAKLKGELDAAQRQQLAALLEEVPAAASDATGTLFFVTPRIGTISPWSSKATDIAWNCGLAAVERIERGIAFHVELPAGADRNAVAALIHDRMIETVLGRFEDAAELFRQAETGADDD